MQQRLTRRQAVTFLLGTTAAAICLPLAAPSATSGDRGERPGAVLGFAGEKLLQLLIDDGALASPPPILVSPEDDVHLPAQADGRTGGEGRLGNILGNFSGNRHLTAPQEFREWNSVVPGSTLPTYDPAAQSGDGRVTADTPEYWRVAVDGEPARVHAVWRKTVPTESSRVSGGAFALSRRHLVTLELDMPIPAGAEISVTVPSWGSVEGRREADMLSEAVHVCQAGYPRTGPKKGYVGLWLGHDASGANGSTDAALSEQHVWRLVTADGETVAQGELRLAKSHEEPHADERNFNGCDIYEADFSDVEQDGEYRLVVEGIGSSFPFAIAQNPYAEVFRLAARWHYHQRSGCAITDPYGEGRTRPRNGHPEDGLTVWRTDLRLGRNSEGFQVEPYAPELVSSQPTGREGDGPGAPHPDAWGGWHDAGDWTRRIQHMDPVYNMANLVEIFEVARTLDMNIPESGKTFADPAVQARRGPDDLGDGETVLPDLIHEALWGISLWRRTQGADGSIIGGVEYGQGGGPGSISWNPVQQTFAYGPEEWSSYYFVIGAAKLGHVVRTVCGDEVLGQALIDEAQAAWDWAETEFAAGRHLGPDNADEEATTSTLHRLRTYAGVVLYRANGNPEGRAAFEAHNPFVPQSEKEVGRINRGDRTYMAHDYVKAGEEGREVNQEIADSIKGWLRWRVDGEERMGADYGLHNSALYPWGTGWLRFGPGSNWRASHLGHEYILNGGDAAPLRDRVIEGMWFGLGCNPSNTSFIHGMGKRDFSDPLVIDLDRLPKVPGLPVFGVAGGRMRPFERDRTRGFIYPAEQDDWPIYTQIYECSTVIICAEHGLRGNMIEWLFASAMAAEVSA